MVRFNFLQLAEMLPHQSKRATGALNLSHGHPANASQQQHLQQQQQNWMSQPDYFGVNNLTHWMGLNHEQGSIL
jgi:hypothetical protein